MSKEQAIQTELQRYVQACLKACDAPYGTFRYVKATRRAHIHRLALNRIRGN